MSCGGRVYKGDTVTISVPFDVSGYTNLSITYSTTGDSKIVKTQEEVTVEDGFITYTFVGDALDILPDGVIYYTIEYEVDGLGYVASTNTPLYLATPAGYDAKTAEEIYQEGYEAGLEDCSGYTPTDCSSAITVAYQSGYTEGYAQGQEDCPECSGSTDCSSAITEAYESGYTEGYNHGQADCPECDCSSAVSKAFSSGYTNGYDEGYADGYEEGEEDCPSLQYQKGYTATTIQATIRPDTGFDGVKRINLDTTPVYNQGYAAGQADCPECSGGSCTLESGYLELTPQDVEGGPWVVNPSPGSDGFDSFEVADNGYGQQYYDNGYHDGVSSITSGCPMAPKSVGLYDIETTIYPDSGYAGMSYVVVDASQVYNAGYRDGGDGCWDTFRQGYESGVTDGFDTGYESGSTDTWPIAYQSGYTDGFAYGYDSGSTDGFDTGYQSGYTDGQESCDCSAAYGNGYNDGQNGVIKSFLAENDTDYVIAYYYNPTNSWMYYAITGVYMYNDGQSTSDWVYGYCSFSAMSVNGGSWETPTLEYMLGPGWTQIIFAGSAQGLPAAFSMQATSAKTEQFTHLDGLKAVSLPSSIHVLNDTHAFTNNTSLRILSSSLSSAVGDTLTGTDGLNTVISHYKGDSRVTMNPNGTTYNGVFFYPIGYDNTIPNQGRITSWSQIGLF